MNRTLLLDLDGTLVDSVPDLLASCNRMMEIRGLAPFARDEIAAMVGDGAAALIRRIMAARNREATADDIAAFIADYTRHAADETLPYPGIPAMLDRLAHSGWRLAVCTNKPEIPARKVLERLGLLQHFSAIGGGDTYPTRKPDPAHLLATLEAAGGDPARAIMAGDHHNDIAAATAAHIPSIFVTWGYGADPHGATATASNAAELEAQANRLLPEVP